MLKRISLIMLLIGAIGFILGKVPSATSLEAEPGYVQPLMEKSSEPPKDHLGTTMFTWSTIAMPATTPDRLCAAVVYNPINDRIYMYGGATAGAAADRVNLCQEYNPVANTWTDRAPMTNRRNWIKGFWTKNNRIYAIGGINEAGTFLAVNEEYNPVLNTWTTRAPLPEARAAYLGGVWRDSLIYILGGVNAAGAGTNTVFIYNPFTNTWATGTVLPMPADMGDAVIVGDTIFITNAFNRPAGTNWANLVKGWINPASPTSITWITGPTFPAATFNAGATALGRDVYWLGGFIAGVTVNRWFKYDGTTGTISEMSPPYPITLARNCYMTARPLENAIYVIAGDSGGNWDPPNRRYMKAVQLTHDVGVLRIFPRIRISPTRVTPFIGVVKNFGLNPETFTTTCLVYDSIGDTLLIRKDTTITLARGETLAIEFGRITPPGYRVYKFTVYTYLSGDQNPLNDTMRERIVVRVGSDPCGYGYVYESTQEPGDTISFLWIDPTAGTPITGWTPNADDGWVLRTLPFPFRYYGQTLTSIYVVTNGFLTDSANTRFINDSLPTPRVRNGMFGWWEDLDLRTAGTVYQYNDPAGNFVVFAWINVPRYGAPAEIQTFQIVLYRDSVIRFNYLRMTGILTSSTVGIQGRYGADRWFLQYLFNGVPAPHIVDDSVSIKSYLPGPPVNIAEEKYEKIMKTIYNLPKGDGICEIYNITGQLIKRFSLKEKENIQKNLKTGIYFIRLHKGNEKENYKLIITK